MGEISKTPMNFFLLSRNSVGTVLMSRKTSNLVEILDRRGDWCVHHFFSLLLPEDPYLGVRTPLRWLVGPKTNESGGFC